HVLKHQTEDNSRHARDRTNREVYAAGQNDERHSDRDDPDHDGLVEYVENVGSSQEKRRKDRKSDGDEDRQRDHSDLEPSAQRFQQRRPSGTRALGQNGGTVIHSVAANLSIL